MKAMTLVAATTNRHKLRELKKMVAGTGIRLLSLDDYPSLPPVKENGSTLEANALKKARAVARTLGQPALADDSGLFVPALHGQPGVRSARYAGPQCDYGANNRKLLRALAGKTGTARRAYFATTLALVWPGKISRTWTGRLHGRITVEARGTNGFGYDPVFVPAGHKQTLAEMSLSQKNKISHRSRALAKAAAELRKELSKQKVKKTKKSAERK
jgi:XTP/dITP diphosphohydrolase